MWSSDSSGIFRDPGGQGADDGIPFFLRENREVVVEMGGHMLKLRQIRQIRSDHRRGKRFLLHSVNPDQISCISCILSLVALVALVLVWDSVLGQFSTTQIHYLMGVFLRSGDHFYEVSLKSWNQ